MLASLRLFFSVRGVIEVETPLLAATASSHPDLRPIAALRSNATGPCIRQLWLQTSPESHMKRLLAAGSGPIYQICKAFRDGEQDAIHNPEFTMIEWYRPGFDLHQLMSETEELVRGLLDRPQAERISYARLFHIHLALDPHTVPPDDLRRLCQSKGLTHSTVSSNRDRDPWLKLLMESCIQHKLGHERPCFVFDFPASQACMARIRPGNPGVAERFELYLDGVELANGYHELDDPTEQLSRFENENSSLQALGREPVPLDEHLLSALASGLPDCSGAALGLDRLLMLKFSASSISEVISFTTDRA